MSNMMDLDHNGDHDFDPSHNEANPGVCFCNRCLFDDPETSLVNIPDNVDDPATSLVIIPDEDPNTSIINISDDDDDVVEQDLFPLVNISDDDDEEVEQNVSSVLPVTQGDEDDEVEQNLFSLLPVVQSDEPQPDLDMSDVGIFDFTDPAIMVEYQQDQVQPEVQQDQAQAEIQQYQGHADVQQDHVQPEGQQEEMEESITYQPSLDLSVPQLPLPPLPDTNYLTRLIRAQATEIELLNPKDLEPVKFPADIPPSELARRQAANIEFARLRHERTKLINREAARRSRRKREERLVDATMEASQAQATVDALRREKRALMGLLEGLVAREEVELVMRRAHVEWAREQARKRAREQEQERQQGQSQSQGPSQVQVQTRTKARAKAKGKQTLR